MAKIGSSGRLRRSAIFCCVISAIVDIYAVVPPVVFMVVSAVSLSMSPHLQGSRSAAYPWVKTGQGCEGHAERMQR
jgi:hypothetical protein